MSGKQPLDDHIVAAINKKNEAVIAEAIANNTLFENVSVPRKTQPVRAASVPPEAVEDDFERKYMEELAIAEARIFAEKAGHYKLPAKIDPDLVTTFDKEQAKRLAGEFRGKKGGVWLAKRARFETTAGKDPTSGNIGHGGKGVMGKGPIRRSPSNSSVHLTFPALGMYCWYLARVDSDILSALEDLLWEDDTFEVEYTNNNTGETVTATTFIQSIYKLYVSKDTRNNSKRRIAIASDNPFEILAEIGYALLAPYVFSKKQGKKANAGFDALNRQFGRKDGANALFQERCAQKFDSALSRFLEIAIQDSTKLSAASFTNVAIQKILEFANKALKTSGTEDDIVKFYDIAAKDVHVNLHVETAIIARIAYIEAVLKAESITSLWLTTDLLKFMKDKLPYVTNVSIRNYFTDIVSELDYYIIEKIKQQKFVFDDSLPYVLKLRLRIT